MQFRRSANLRVLNFAFIAVPADDEFGEGQQLVPDKIVGIYPFDLVGGYGRYTQIVFDHQLSQPHPYCKRLGVVLVGVESIVDRFICLLYSA